MEKEINGLTVDENLTKISELADRLCGNKIKCAQCNADFTRRDNLQRHIKSQHQQHEEPSTSGYSSKVKGPKCNWCGKSVQLLQGKCFCEFCSKQGVECGICHRPLPQRFYTLSETVCDACHRKKKNQEGRGVSNIGTVEGRLHSYTLKPSSDNKHDILLFFKDNEPTASNILNVQLRELRGLKWYLILAVRLVRYTSEGDEIISEPLFRSLNCIATNHSQLEQQLADAFHKIYESVQTYQKDGSGWVLDEILNMELNVAKFNPFGGSTYVPLPQVLVKKKAVVNIKNSDDLCFVWSVLAALYPANKDPNRVQHYIPYLETLNLEGLNFPLTLSQVPKFEAQNFISINVFGYEGSVFPLHITSKRCDIHVNLLLVSKDDIQHYCLIRSLSRLLGDRTNHQHHTHFCDYCLHGYSSKTLLDNHLPHCTPFGLQRTFMPAEKALKFKNIRHQLRVPFVIYADFECFTVKSDDCTSKSVRYQKHEPSSFCYAVICDVAQYSKPAIVYRGPHVVETFLRELMKENEYICNILNQTSPMIISPEQECAFQTANHCHICGNPLGEDRVRDHCHISGMYRGPAHNKCNLQFRFRTTTKEEVQRFFIPVVLHNCRGYDSHLICNVMGMFRHLKIKCIANNMQKYISFSLGNFRFIDSLQFLNASLETLITNMLKDGADQFFQLKQHFSDPNQQNMLLRKGVFPYTYITDPNKFEETQLPDIGAFYNDLREEALSSEDYIHAQTVWKEFGIDNLGEYQDLYIKTDVLLLADIFENFRDICLSYYKLDPLHYYTSPGLSWDAMLKMTGVELELLQNVDMHLMVEQGIRGGISMITTKYAKANNPYLSDYDSAKSISYISYLDANNLYGWAMSKYLPMKDFTWMTEHELETLDIMSVPDDAYTGYILEVDLTYPNDLHNLHNDYPLCPERMTVTDELLSNYSKILKNHLELKGKPTEKLVPNLHNKSKYVIHYSALKFCLAQGMVLTKIHRGITFVQSPWLKSYIDFNTEKRKHAKNDFEKDFFKLMNNAVFGKTMENLRKRSRVELVHDNVKLEKLIAKPSFQSFRIFNQDLCGVHMMKTKLVLNRPIYVGFTILDISKILMYDFHYNYMKIKYGEKLKLLFTDTDSLCYFIECEDIYHDIGERLDLFDTSNYLKDHSLFSSTNAKVLGKMKDETAGEPISEFVGLRPKMYSMIFSGQEKKTAKGVAKYVVKKRLRHVMYKEALFNRRTFTSNMNCIRSYDHNLFSVNMNKIGLSPFDDKRYVLDNGVDTLAHGHCKIML